MRRYLRTYVGKNKHPRADSFGYVHAHILVVENAVGKFIPQEHPIHHVDYNKHNNDPGNLVVCEDIKYHKLLHTRQRVLALGGDPNTQKFCPRCENLLSIDAFYAVSSSSQRPDGRFYACKECARKSNRDRYGTR